MSQAFSIEEAPRHHPCSLSPSERAEDGGFYTAGAHHVQLDVDIRIEQLLGDVTAPPVRKNASPWIDVKAPKHDVQETDRS